VSAAAALRPARPADAAAIAAIYNEGIASREATFETAQRDEHDVVAWLAAGLPFLVAEAGGTVVGWARVSPASDRKAYAGVGEHGVYVAAAAQGAGLGRALLEALCAEAERAGFHKLHSRIFATNAPSLAIHRAAGFREVGVQVRHGSLDGEWKDCVLVERLLGDAARAPSGAAD
jgi:L-amino acid N-acyltransferase YncA